MVVWNRAETRLPSWGSIITARLLFVFSGCCGGSHIWITSGVLLRACALYSLPWNCSPCCCEGEYILHYYYSKLFLSIWFFLFGIFIVAKSSLLTTYGANSIRSENVFPYINNWCLFLYADNLNIRIIQVLFSPRCLAVLKYVDVWPNHFEPCITNWIYHPTRGMTSWLSLYPSQISISFFFLLILNDG